MPAENAVPALPFSKIAAGIGAAQVPVRRYARREPAEADGLPPPGETWFNPA